jgi:hypothetical protein
LVRHSGFSAGSLGCHPSFSVPGTLYLFEYLLAFDGECLGQHLDLRQFVFQTRGFRVPYLVGMPFAYRVGKAQIVLV